MMPLSAGDMQLRLRRMLPARWWADEAPVLDGLLLGLGTALAAIYGLIAYARQQTRLATAAAPWLDLAAQDFLAGRLQRRPQEADDAFRVRLLAAMQRPRATRGAVVQAVLRVTGGTPWVFEPRRPADTGGVEPWLPRLRRGWRLGLAWASRSGVRFRRAATRHRLRAARRLRHVRSRDLCRAGADRRTGSGCRDLRRHCGRHAQRRRRLDAAYLAICVKAVSGQGKPGHDGRGAYPNLSRRSAATCLALISEARLGPPDRLSRLHSTRYRPA